MNNDLGTYNVFPIGYTATLAPGTGDEQGAISKFKDNICTLAQGLSRALPHPIYI
jgi:hypothetical protein